MHAVSCRYDLYVACDCNLAGVRDNGDCANLNESLSLGECNCKQNTEGRTCGTCRPGFFNLSMENEVGCQGMYRIIMMQS